MHDTERAEAGFRQAVADCIRQWVAANYPPAPQPAPGGEFRPDAILMNLAFEALDLAFYVGNGLYGDAAELVVARGVTAHLIQYENDRASSTWFRAMDWFEAQPDAAAAEAGFKRTCTEFFAPLDALLAVIPHPEMPVGDMAHDAFVAATPRDPDDPSDEIEF